MSGTKVMDREVGSETFFCPNCRQTTECRLLRYREWFTLYWVPIVPMRDVARAVECSVCRQKYKEPIPFRSGTGV